jgi:hypothetical protein
MTYPRPQRLRYPCQGFAVIRIDPLTSNWRRRRTFLARNGKLSFAESIKRAFVFPTYADALAACDGPGDVVHAIYASSPGGWHTHHADPPALVA